MAERFEHGFGQPLVHPLRAVALVHAGWRGTAAGIVERAIHRLVESWQATPGRLWLHCGPAICGACIWCAS